MDNMNVFLFAIPLFLVAVVIVILNDRLKSRRTRNRKAAAGSPTRASSMHYTRWRDIVVLVVGVVGISVGFVLAPEVTKWAMGGLMIVLVGIVVYLLLKGILKVIGLYLKALFTAKWPTFARLDQDGMITMKCPQCGTKVKFSKGDSDESVFVCSNCGLEGTLQTGK